MLKMQIDCCCMCGCFGNMCTCIYCVFVLFVLCFCIVPFMYIYSYLLLPQSENSIAVNNNNNNDIQRMWNLKCTIVPVITGATGTETRSLRKIFESVPRKHSIDSLQKTAKLGTSHIIWKILQCEA